MFNLINSLSPSLFISINLSLSIVSLILILKYRKQEKHHEISVLVITLFGGIIMSAAKIIEQYIYNSIMLLIMEILSGIYFVALLVCIFFNVYKKYKNGLLTDEQIQTLKTCAILLAIVAMIIIFITIID